ncbi:MAG TPA: carboxypeptidase regulatory-like domain-containing protein [Vicinamibacterales bacterium]|nr:carboxypeptidase regulatory-like domain-containing protein [Vicinamibacterales bacterium]
MAALLLSILFAQSPNTASLVVIATDQSGAVVPGAQVSITNGDIGLSRDAATGDDGSVTVAALPIVGAYSVTVTKPGFEPQTIQAVVLRAGETATVRARLTASGGSSEVVVYGTTQGVRADPELGTRLESAQIDQAPLLGRKISALPLMNAAFRNAKGTGDLFMNSVYVVAGAGGRREADYVVDGATGDEPWGRQTMFSTIPVGAVQEMDIRSRAFSAEFGWTASAAINIVTKSGTNTTHGEALFLGRPGGAQSTQLSADAQCPGSVATCVPPTSNGAVVSLVPPDIPDSLAQGSIAIGGAFVPDRTHYFVAGDGTWQDRTAAITSPLAPAGSTYLGHYRQALVDLRIDHAINSANTLMARGNLDRFSDTNPQDAIGGNVLASAGRQFSRHAYTAQVNETAVLSASMLNEARVEFQNADPVTAFDPLTPSTQITRAGSVPFTSGESRYAHIFSRIAQFRDTLSLTHGRHYLRIGGSVAENTSGGDGTEFGSAFVLGQFTAVATTTKPGDQLTLADMQRYQQSFNLGQGTYTLSQWIYDVFAQDSWRVRDDVTLDLGLRYDRQTFSDSTTNVAPRVGFGWNPGGDSKTAVRGGYGLYYTMLRANIDANFTLGGPQGIFSYTATPGQTGFPTCVTCTPVAYNANAALSTLPARNITIRPGMTSYYAQFFDVSKLPGYASATFDNPKSQVGSIGIERELAPRWFVSVDYVKQHWTGIDQTVDLNAPSYFARTAPGQVRSAAAADLTRPILPVNGGFRQINVVENLGVADYDGLQTMLRWQATRGFLSVSYTLSKSTNTTEPNGNGAGQNDFNQLGEVERGPSLLDQRHRAVVFGSYRLPYDVTIGATISVASAKPFNPTTGVDNNGDGNNNDRPIIDGVLAGRYSFRGTPISSTDLFADYRLPTRGSRAVTLRAEAFNVFNHANVLARNGTYGDTGTPLSTFGQATPGLASIDPGRMMQFQVRFSF